MAECDIQTLIDDNPCFLGLSREAKLAVIAQLLCDISSASGGGGGPPAGTILMWHGTIASIPAGYVLCDGNNGTPDLRNRFVVAANADSGGAAKSTITGVALQTGGATTNSTSGSLDVGTDFIATGGGDFNHTFVSAVAFSIVPSFYALAYIMKT